MYYLKIEILWNLATTALRWLHITPNWDNYLKQRNRLTHVLFQRKMISPDFLTEKFALHIKLFFHTTAAFRVPAISARR